MAQPSPFQDGNGIAAPFVLVPTISYPRPFEVSTSQLTRPIKTSNLQWMVQFRQISSCQLFFSCFSHEKCHLRAQDGQKTQAGDVFRCSSEKATKITNIHLVPKTEDVLLVKIEGPGAGIPSIIIYLLLKGFLQTPLLINQPVGKGHLCL